MSDVNSIEKIDNSNILNFAKEQDYISEERRVELYIEAEILIKKIRAFKNSLFRK